MTQHAWVAALQVVPPHAIVRVVVPPPLLDPLLLDPLVADPLVAGEPLEPPELPVPLELPVAPEPPELEGLPELGAPPELLDVPMPPELPDAPDLLALPPLLLDAFPEAAASSSNKSPESERVLAVVASSKTDRAPHPTRDEIAIVQSALR